MSGVKFYQYQTQLPPKDFKILVADFENSSSANHDVTKQIFSNLQTEMREYGDDVKVRRIGKLLENIQEAKQIGKKTESSNCYLGRLQSHERSCPHPSEKINGLRS